MRKCCPLAIQTRPASGEGPRWVNRVWPLASKVTGPGYGAPSRGQKPDSGNQKVSENGGRESGH
jgi:hypothetical protein